MSFTRLARRSEKQPHPLPAVRVFGCQKKGCLMTTEQELQDEIDSMWADMRKSGDMVIDAPGRKVGMPWAVPYEGVCFPVEIDGEFVLASIPADQVERFALALASVVPLSMALDGECDAEIAAHGAISKAKGGR